jgi:hypothetical protein
MVSVTCLRLESGKTAPLAVRISYAPLRMESFMRAMRDMEVGRANKIPISSKNTSAPEERNNPLNANLPHGCPLKFN